MRALAWLAVVALAVAGRLSQQRVLALAALGLAIVLLGLQVPRALRCGVAGIAGAAALLLFFGGAELCLAATPALFCSFVAWMFARSLRAPRRALIGRAMAAVDGEALAAQPAMIAYARKLTLLWAIWLGLWAVAEAVLVALDRTGIASAFAWLPSARLVALAMPLGVALLFVAEFALRPWLLPGAPRLRFGVFLTRIVRAWPRLLDDESAPVGAPVQDEAAPAGPPAQADGDDLRAVSPPRGSGSP